MKATGALFILFVMLSCGSWFVSPQSGPGPDSGVSSAQASAVVECPRQQVVIDLIADLEQCEAAIAACDAPEVKKPDQPKVPTQSRVRERVVLKPKRCANSGPVIVPVRTTKCADGQLCLDDEAQLAYAKNQMAYEAWIKQVQDCEAQ